MTRTPLGFLALLTLPPALLAWDKPESPTPAQQYQALLQEYDKAMKDFQKASQEAKTPQERQKVVQVKYPRPEKFAPRFLELAKKNPMDAAAVDSLAWIVTNMGPVKINQKSPQSEARLLLLRDHM
jgi:hypothetical protein